MTYVISDIHGNFPLFTQILSQIKFSRKDHLYIIGDMIDGGPDGIRVVREAMTQSNIHALLGNHEYLMLQALQSNSPGAMDAWIKNGGEPTLREYNSLPIPARTSILSFLSSLPDHADISIKGSFLRKAEHFHLVHGCPGNSPDKRLWGRLAKDADNPFPDGRRVIVGHTPTFFYDNSSLTLLNAMQGVGSGVSSAKILAMPGFINIDCGCGYAGMGGRLGCLCLDNMKAYYAG